MFTGLLQRLIYLDEMVAMLHLDKLGVVFEELSSEQANTLESKRMDHLNQNIIDIKPSVGSIETKDLLFDFFFEGNNTVNFCMKCVIFS